MTKTIEVPCGKCGKIIHAVYEHDAYNPCPVEWLDKLSACLCCDDCLLQLGRMTRREYHHPFGLSVDSAPPEDLPETGNLPYKDE